MILEMWQYANTNTDGMFSTLILIGLYAVIALNVMLNKREFASAFIAAGTITTFVALFLRIAGLIPDNTFFITAMACIIPTLIALFMPKD